MELLNFSIGIDFLGPDPASSKNKAEKNLQLRFSQTLGPYRHVCLLSCAL